MPARDQAADQKPSRPRVWLLLDDRPGHRTQVRGLARLLELEAEEKHLAFTWLNRLPNPLLGSSLLSLCKGEGAHLSAPWPDLVIAMGRRLVPVARWIKKKSGGRTRILLLGRKAANSMADIDMALVCAHFRLLAHPARHVIVSPPTQVEEALLAAELERLGDPMPDLARPRAVLLVGGPTAQHAMKPAFAGRMAAAVEKAAATAGLSLAIVTSRRTPDAAVAAIREAAPGAQLHLWRPDAEVNPYLAFLAAADCLVVTGESESMLAEAVATGKPLTIYPLEPRPLTPKQRLSDAVARAAEGKGPGARACRGLIEGGWFTPLRDLELMHRLLAEQGRAALFDGSINRQKPRPAAEIKEIAARVFSLIADGESLVAGSEP